MIDQNCHTDAELLQLLYQGDKTAFTCIYERYWKILFNSTYKRLKNKEQSQDIVQAVFSDLWRRRKEVIIENLSAYLHKAVRFQVFKLISRKPSLCEFLDEFDVILTSPIRADDDLLEKEILILVKLWVDALPQKRRTIFLMFVNDELSTREIAVKLGISQKTVQNQLNTAVTTLRARLVQVLSVFLIASSHFK